MRISFSARRHMIKALDLAGYICPEASKTADEMRARDAFRRGMNRDSALNVISFGLTQEFLARAGHDIRSDAPYRQVLGFAGGRQEFEALVPEKYRTAQFLPSLKPEGIS